MSLILAQYGASYRHKNSIISTMYERIGDELLMELLTNYRQCQLGSYLVNHRFDNGFQVRTRIRDAPDVFNCQNTARVISQFTNWHAVKATRLRNVAKF